VNNLQNLIRDFAEKTIECHEESIKGTDVGWRLLPLHMWEDVISPHPQ
jgi:hypothetical protein